MLPLSIVCLRQINVPFFKSIKKNKIMGLLCFVLDQASMYILFTRQARFISVPVSELDFPSILFLDSLNHEVSPDPTTDLL